MRAAFAILCSCVLFALAAFVGSAQAGDYYDGYSRPRSSANVWYSSDCCYKKVVRHVQQVRYVRSEPVRHHGYYDAPRYRESYYAPPRDHYYQQPARYTDVYVAPPRYSTYAPSPVRYSSHHGYDAYNAAYAAPASECYSRRVPVLDGRGGWVWGVRRVCN